MAKAANDETQPLLKSNPPPEIQPARSKQSFTNLVVSIAACAAWMMVSSMLIIINKHIMVDLKFHYPMTVSGMGMAVSGFAGWCCCRIFNLVESKQKLDIRFYIVKIMPVGFFMALTLFTGNQVYLYLTVAFIQMLKAFTPVITMIALFFARLEDPTARLVNSVLLISLGTAVAACGEVNMSLVGLACMFTSEAAEAIRLVLTQYLLVGLKFHPIEGLMYLAPACCMWLLVGVMLKELPQILATNALAIPLAHKVEFLAAACMGFLVNALAYTVIKVAGSLTLKVLGTVKNTLLVVIGVVFLKEVVTSMQGLGYVISLAGFVWYNQIKMSKAAPNGRA